MSYHHANVALSQGQINKLNAKSSSASGISLTLKHSQLNGNHKISVTQTQLNQIARARASGKGLRLDFSAAAVRDMAKSGEIFPLIPIISAAIPGLLGAAAKAAALGAVGTAAGMALKKAVGKGYQKRGGIFPLAALAAAQQAQGHQPTTTRNNKFGALLSGIINQPNVMRAMASFKKSGAGLRFPGTPPSWYPR